MSQSEESAASAWVVRPVEVADAAAVVGLLNPIIEAGVFTVLSEQFSAEEQATFIQELPERGVYNAVCCAKSGMLVAVQDVLPTTENEHVGEISTFVSLENRRRGIGHIAMSATLEQARDRGFQTVTATIRATNAQALGFYASEGFRRVDGIALSTIVGGRRVDQVVTAKDLR